MANACWFNAASRTTRSSNVAIALLQHDARALRHNGFSSHTLRVSDHSHAAPSSLAARYGANMAVPARAARHVCQAAAAEVVQNVTAFDDLARGMERKYLMISGKGGVGKTSLSASLAVKLAEAGHQVLVVSTDPAHSLSDALDQDVSGGKPVAVEGTDLPLWAMEIDPEEAKAEFRSYSAKAENKQKVDDFMKGMGLGMIAEQLADLKLGELLNTPPPGLDEAVAIAKVVQFVQSAEYARFTRIIFDTAPTGHTLRLLSLPDFVDASLGKIVRIRKRLSGASAAIKGLFGASEQQDSTIEKLEKLQESMTMVKQLFRSKDTTEFIIATIPTVLGINESRRLVKSLRKEGIPVKRIIVNQIVGDKQGEAYIRMKLKDQERALHIIETDPQLSSLNQIQAPLVDLEVRGIPALTYFGHKVWQEQLPEAAASPDRRYFMLGGKGGVGKTSLSASLAVQLAEAGHATLIVSTDPAHSLSDSIDQNVSGGTPVRITTNADLPLWGMEIDPEAARKELADVIGRDNGAELNRVLDSVGLSGISQQLKDLELGDLLDNPPPGIDEAVAIAKVVQFLKADEYAHFTRIVFDTAPTGHTLRLLTLPDFLDASIGKIVRLRRKLTQARDAVKNFFGAGKPGEIDEAEEKLSRLRERMEEARQLFRNKEQTQFVIVSIPTVMAANESSRLAAALRKEEVPVKTIIINQVVQAGSTEKFLAKRRADQQRALAVLRSDADLSSLQVIEGQLFDLEVRGLAALNYFGTQIWQKHQ